MRFCRSVAAWIGLSPRAILTWIRGRRWMYGWIFKNTSTSLGANIKYHGLINLGATCYLNSVLQVLFLTKDFRDAVRRFSSKNPHTEFIDHHLQDLFDDLQKHTADTHKITEKLGIIRVNEQRDAPEYVERILRMSSPETSQVFHGALANQITCSNGHTETDRLAPFWHLPLPLVDFCNKDYSVVDGIEEFFRPTDLNGENQMYCDRCGHKVDATITDVIIHHPDVLILLLKRFEFNYHHMKYIKINCSVDVPETLQIPKNMTYELYAVVDHFGDLRSGHYTATIKTQEKHEERWYQFNDTRVTLLDYQPLQVHKKSQSAYLLFYRKKKSKKQKMSSWLLCVFVILSVFILCYFVLYYSCCKYLKRLRGVPH
ncbi:ubiquitin carboxyl-terminal hydrolase 47-like [Archocentrus centrarchus]|uniref:ubiquitin carboxyl-terminal hydrolase 47-like n=1 Tax=Archocentrus centrarchus TaxID=63155 RepID=UPI0011E9B7FD|nr:ubiquitin carboxyl-terminal hydrolase 47-like [Archocentrus centrarchus]